MAKVIVHTSAYNAEKTISRTADSIFAQTHSDWIWYAVDNGSTDKTGEMIRGFAEKDARVIPLRNDQNHVWKWENSWPYLVKTRDDNEYFCWLDADDEYKPGFIERMLGFMAENSLDVACCGSDYTDAVTGKLKHVSGVEKDIVVEGRGFSQHFIGYHQFMRTYWAKLFKISLFRNYDFARTRNPGLIYGGDTLFAQEMFRNSGRVGFLSERLHKYYVSPKSVSYAWDKKRIESDRVLYKAARDFLTDKCGHVTNQNAEAIFIIYMNAITDTRKILLNADVPEPEKIAGIIDIFTHEYTRKLAAATNLGASFGQPEYAKQMNELLSTTVTWLLDLKEVPDELVEGYCEAGEFLCAAAEYAEGWILFKKLHARFLLDNNRASEASRIVAELFELLPGDAEISEMMECKNI